jgi:hypothetical protein
MMKAKNVQGIICLIIFFLFANQAWAADWIYYDTAAVGDMYYDKSSIKKVNENIISVWNKNILSKDAKTKYFSILEERHKAPPNPSVLSYYTKLMEIDCVNKRIKDISVTFYDEKGKFIYSSPKSESGEWKAIIPNTVGEKLINVVSCEPVTPKEVVVAPKVEEPVTPKEAVAAPKVEEPVTPKEAVAAPKVEEPVAPKEVVVAPKVEEPVTPKEAVVSASAAADDLAQVNSNKSDWVEFYTSKMGNVTSYKKVTTKKDQTECLVKEVFSDKGKKEYIQNRIEKKLSIEGYDKLSNIQSLSEINCNEKMIMSISVSDFDTDGKKLDSYFVDKPKWVKIRNDSFFDYLKKEVCK